MALDTAPKIRAKRLIFGKLETTTGTLATSIAAADAVTLAYDPSIVYAHGTKEIPKHGGSLAPQGRRVTTREGTASFSVELAGDGASTNPDWFKYMRACGMGFNTATLTPTSSPTETVTLGMNTSGKRRTLLGCMGSWEIVLNAGDVGMVNFNFSGIPDAEADEVIFTPTYETTIPPIVSAAAITIGGTTYYISSMTISSNNNVILRKCLTGVDSAGNATGYRAAYIVDRRITVRVDPESLPLATKDWGAAFTARTTFALSAAIGDDANNTITIAAPKMALVSFPGQGDRDGLLTDELEFECLQSTSGADDDMTIVAS